MITHACLLTHSISRACAIAVQRIRCMVHEPSGTAIFGLHPLGYT